MAKLSKTAKFLALPLLIWFFYNGLLMHNYGRFRTGPEPQNYFRNLAHSLLQGRLDIDCPEKSGCYDILKYEGKNYLYWPPAPALAIYTPIVAVLGVETPDKLISSIIGVFNIWLFSMFLLLFSRRFDLPLRTGGILLLTLFWGMGTVHFYMSMKGSIWCMAQVCAQTFLLLAFIFALLRNSWWSILLSGLCFGLACYTRNHLIFCYALLGAIQWYQWEAEVWKKKIGRLLLFGFPFVCLSLLNLYYNYARFGDPLDNGMAHQLMSSFLVKDFEQYGFFNLHYLPKNLWVQVLSPPFFSESFPFFKLGWHKEGFSFFWASPLFLLLLPSLFFWIKSNFKKSATALLSLKDRRIMGAALVALLGVATPIMLNIAPGWRQFASRYSLDYQLMMIVLMLFLLRIWGDKKYFAPTVIFLVFLSVYVNYFGAHMFLGLAGK